jgi:hypothetical protein
LCGSLNVELKHSYYGQGNDSHYAKVVCIDCGVSSAEHFIWDKEDIDKVISAWNTRIIP